MTRLATDNHQTWDSHLGLVLSAAAVAAAEDYFRSVLVEVVQACPACLELAGSQLVPLEFVSTGELGAALRSTLEKTSLSSSASVEEATKQLLGLKLKGQDHLRRHLRTYETICQIRHCSTHSGGYVNPHNAKILEIEPGSWLTFDGAHAINQLVVMLLAAIRAYNQAVFEHVVGRWLDDGLLKGDWSTDKLLFEPLWESLRSEVDREAMSAANVESGLPSNGFQAHRRLAGAARSRARTKS